MPPALGAASADEPEPGTRQPVDAPAGSAVVPRERIPSRTRQAVVITALATLLGGALAGAATTLSDPTYTSESHVLWSPGALEYLGETVPTDPNALDRQVVDQSAVIFSDAVLGTAAEGLGVDPDDLREELTVSLQDGSSLLVIAATAPEAATATETTDAVTTAYVDYVRTSGADALRQQADLLQSSIDRLNGELEAANRELEAVNGELAGISVNSPAYAIAQGRADRAATRSADAQTRLADLIGQQESLRAAAEAFTGEAFVMRQATEPEAPSSPSLVTSLVLGGGLGFFIGLCVVFFFLGRRSPVASARTTP
ncbi:hypothetical protein ACWKWC_10995 [Geodermatophilus nigrescens]